MPEVTRDTALDPVVSSLAQATVVTTTVTDYDFEHATSTRDPMPSMDDEFADDDNDEVQQLSEQTTVDPTLHEALREVPIDWVPTSPSAATEPVAGTRRHW